MVDNGLTGALTNDNWLPPSNPNLQLSVDLIFLSPPDSPTLTGSIPMGHLRLYACNQTPWVTLNDDFVQQDRRQNITY